MKLTKAQHPLTRALTSDANGEHVPKRYVRKMSGAIRCLRPFWKGTWGCWCVTDGGPQQLFWDAENFEFTVTDPAGRSALQPPEENT